ncbi:MAG: conserved membrane protein of unknown function [Candidatus Thorarchaeota archaeon]|nr:MAG: conserved membrane protein of unknown function [Candidatus Thorarchaeota archaeon]
MNNKKSFILCIVAGALLLLANAVGSLGIFALLGQVSTIPELEPIVPIITMILWVLNIIANLGGIGVIIGGYLLTTAKVGTGKFIIGIAAGMGLIGMIIGIIQIIYVSGFGAALDFFGAVLYSVGGFGAILSIVARRMASTE